MTVQNNTVQELHYAFPSVSYNELLTGIGEVVPLGNGLRLFFAVGRPDDLYFRPDGNNARTRACPYEPNMPHQRGTFPERLQTRLPNDFQVQSSIQIPWVTQLVDTDDRGWDGTRFNGQPGTDFLLWNSSEAGSNVANWARMFYVRVTVVNQLNQRVAVAFVGNPLARTATRTVIRDVGQVPPGTVDIPPASEGSATTPRSGTVIWKHQLQPAGQTGDRVTKRFRYTPTAGGGAILNLWIVPWCGTTGV